MFFLILFAILLILAIGGSFYLARAFHRFSFVQKIAEKHPKIAWMISFVPIAILVIVGIFNVFTGIVSAIHLIIIWMLFDAVGYILRKITHSPRKHYYAGAFAMIFTTLLMCYAWIVAHQVVETDYTLFTEKDLGQEKLRIVQIADAHLGVTLNGSEFAAEMKKINDLHPDLVTVVGDFVDDDTSREDMETAVKALGEISSSYGTFYVFGNHDKGYSQDSRDFTADDLCRTLEQNDIHVLKDEVFQISDCISLIGRLDKSIDNRLPIAELADTISPNQYSIVLDHQPNDYQAEKDANVDLVLSGHTHGGQFFPCGPIGVLIGANDAFYGHHTNGQTDFIITSGISAWSIPLKTGTVSEYVVIDLIHSKNIES